MSFKFNVSTFKCGMYIHISSHNTYCHVSRYACPKKTQPREQTLVCMSSEIPLTVHTPSLCNLGNELAWRNSVIATEKTLGVHRTLPGNLDSHPLFYFYEASLIAQQREIEDSLAGSGQYFWWGRDALLHITVRTRATSCRSPCLSLRPVLALGSAEAAFQLQFLRISRSHASQALCFPTIQAQKAWNIASGCRHLPMGHGL